MVDAQSGVIQWYYGLKNWDFYTVLFGVGSRPWLQANITWDRALGYALERPKSVTTDIAREVGRRRRQEVAAAQFATAGSGGSLGQNSPAIEVICTAAAGCFQVGKASGAVTTQFRMTLPV